MEYLLNITFFAVLCYIAHYLIMGSNKPSKTINGIPEDIANTIPDKSPTITERACTYWKGQIEREIGILIYLGEGEHDYAEAEFIKKYPFLNELFTDRWEFVGVDENELTIEYMGWEFRLIETWEDGDVGIQLKSSAVVITRVKGWVYNPYVWDDVEMQSQLKEGTKLMDVLFNQSPEQAEYNPYWEDDERHMG